MSMEYDDAEPVEQEVQEEEEEDNESGGAEEEEEGGNNSQGEEVVADSAKLTAQINEVNDQSFDELQMMQSMKDAVTSTWNQFLNSAVSREAAGEAIYAALFDSAPSLQSLFKSPRAVMAVRFMTGIGKIIQSLEDPAELKVCVETLGFQHLQLEVTVPRVVIFRDALCDLISMEVGDGFTTHAREAWQILLNYVGGAFIYVRFVYADRVSILASSWATANNKDPSGLQDHLSQPATSTSGGSQDHEGHTESMEERAKDKRKKEIEEQAKKAMQEAEEQKRKEKEKDKGKSDGRLMGWGRGKAKGQETKETEEATEDAILGKNASVPKTFNDMFLFNAVVMGFGANTWMSEVLASFDTIVTNVSNSYRLQEECDILSLRLSKYKGQIVLSQYKAVMLASLRSLVPKDWNSNHEVAWSWLWENVERMLKAMTGRPAMMERALGRLFGGLGDDQRQKVRTSIYTTFFSRHPAGQDVFKQSTTRLHFIADRVLSMTQELYKDPKKMAEDISALGLRHVGYGIPTELFSPFVTTCVDVLRGVTEDDEAEEGFRWSLSLISRILVRVINEGNTIVMRAININCGKQLQKAVSCAPRGQRAMWVLNVQVGTQSISPLLWAIETGSHDAAKAVIEDLLAIRADRDRYYYGMDQMFERHPDIVKRLCNDAPNLLPTLLDGLIWRSRFTEASQRRVNYYVKHLLLDSEGAFAPSIEWLMDHGNPKLACHPVMVLILDLIWSKVAFRTFLFNKSWFLFTLIVFVCSQSIVTHGTIHMNHSDLERGFIAACRIFIYVCCMGHRFYMHCKNTVHDLRNKQIVWVYRVPVCDYLTNWQESASLALCVVLMAMFCVEPILHCIPHWREMPEHATEEDLLYGYLTQECEEAFHLKLAYHVLSMIAVLLYFSLIIDLSVVSTKISAFVLVCCRVLSEVGLFMFAWLFSTIAFSCALITMHHELYDFRDVWHATLAMIKLVLGLFEVTFEMMEVDPILFITLFVYSVISVIFLINLLIAQLNCSYQSTYQDMVGFARLNRGRTIVEVMPAVPRWRWDRFIDTLQLDKRIEFGEGDIGLAGGLQVLEPAGWHPTTVETIQRFGGSTSPSAQWPQDPAKAKEDDDRILRMEKMADRIMRKLNGKHGHGSKGGSASGSSASWMQSNTQNSNSSGSSGMGNGDE